MLLILAGITITYVLGEDGIIAQAQLAAQKTKEAEEKELKDFDNITGILSEVVNGKDPDKLEDAITSHKIFANTTSYDENGKKNFIT